jgi:predicted dehydrogenase
VSSTTLGVGVIGLGVGEQHVRAFAAQPGCRVVALCDRNAEKLHHLAEQVSAPRRYSSADQLIADPDVQVVSIASNDDDHSKQVLHALSLGKHVFVEKPLCLDQIQLKSIARAWRGAGGARLSTNTLLRRSPRFRRLKRDVDAGLLGKIYCIEGDYIYGRLHKLVTGWRGEISDYSVMLGGGIHVVDLMLWLAGERPVEVTAYGSSLGSSGTGFSGTDLVLALLRFDSGLLAKIGANFASHYSHFHRFTVYGTQGTFENLPAAVSSSARLWIGRDAGAAPQAIDDPYPAVGKGDLIPSFVSAIRGEGEPDITEAEVFAAVAVCLAIDRSLVERRPVQIEYEET